MPIQVVAQHPITVGTDIAIEGAAPQGPFSVVFEDDGDTAYCYALDRTRPEQPIQDAMHVYDVASVADRERPSTVTIGWSLDALKAVLLINEYPHAVFDFSAKRGYCRTGFPPPAAGSGWSGHAWDDAVAELFADPA
ncbi:DUF2251 domain-containing protein [Xanthomonas sp. Kuri4-1]